MGPLDLVALFAAAIWGVICGAIAASKRRSFALFFLVGTIGGFVALVAALGGMVAATPQAPRETWQWLAAAAALGPLLLALIFPAGPRRH